MDPLDQQPGFLAQFRDDPLLLLGPGLALALILLLVWLAGRLGG